MGEHLSDALQALLLDRVAALEAEVAELRTGDASRANAERAMHPANSVPGFRMAGQAGPRLR